MMSRLFSQTPFSRAHSFFKLHYKGGCSLAVFSLLLLTIDLMGVRDVAWLLDSLDGKRFWVNYLLSLVVLWGVWRLARGRSPWLRLGLSLFVGAALYSQTAYYGVYQKLIGVFDLRFFVADPVMALSLYAENGSALWPLVVGGLGGGVFWMWLRGPVMSLGRGHWKGWTIGALSMAVFALLTVNWYSAPNLQAAPVSLASAMARLADVRVGKNTQSIAKPTVPQQAAPANAPSVVWVIGESVNKTHLGVYGYTRNTTPFLSSMVNSGQAVAFTDALAVGPRTMVSVPYLLTGLQNIDPHGRIYTVPSVFNYAKAAGYQTALITSQDFQWRNVDKLFVDRDLGFFRQGSDFSPDVNVSVGANDHDVLSRGIVPWLKSTGSKQPFLLVTQMSGSHPPFDKQVPANRKTFLPEDHPNGINAYDNTLVYTDDYLRQLVAAARQANPNTWVFFTTDHGTHVTGQGNMFHGDLGEPVIRVPLVVMPPAAQAQHLKAKASTPVAHADIMATVLDLMGVSPVRPIDGLSWLQPVPEQRVRITTSYVTTLHNDPVAALMLGNGTRYEINFDQRSVTAPNGQVMPYNEWNAEFRAVFEPWLKAAQ